MSDCYNATGVNKFTGSSLLQPDSYYYQSYYRQPTTFGVDSVSSLDFEPKQDAAIFPLTSQYEDYVTPEVTSYGMLPSLLQPASTYYDEKHRITADNSNFRFQPYVSASPPGGRIDQFPVFADPYSSSVPSSVTQLPDVDSSIVDHRSVVPTTLDYQQTKIESKNTPDRCDVISGIDSQQCQAVPTIVPQINMHKKTVHQTAFTDNVVPSPSRDISHDVSRGMKQTANATSVSNADVNFSCKTANNGK